MFFWPPFREITRRLPLTINKPSFEKSPIKYRNGVLFSNRNCETGEGKLFDFRGYLGRKPSSDRLFEFRGLWFGCSATEIWNFYFHFTFQRTDLINSFRREEYSGFSTSFILHFPFVPRYTRYSNCSNWNLCDLYICRIRIPPFSEREFHNEHRPSFPFLHFFVSFFEIRFRLDFGEGKSRNCKNFYASTDFIRSHPTVV